MTVETREYIETENLKKHGIISVYEFGAEDAPYTEMIFVHKDRIALGAVRKSDNELVEHKTYTKEEWEMFIHLAKVALHDLVRGETTQ